MKSIDLNEVSTFVRVVEAGSLSAAARALDVPKSTVSRRLARLEERLGVRLLQRTTRRMGLTEAGQRYYDRVGAAVTAIGDAAHELDEDERELRGPVRLTAPPDFGHPLLVRLLDFAREHPRVSVEVDLSSRVVDLVQEGFDLAVRASDRLDPSLIARRLGTEAGWVVASPEWVAAHGAPATPAEAAARPWVLFRPRGGTSRVELRRDGETAALEVRGPLGGHDFQFVRFATLAGAGIAMLPSFVAALDVAHGRLVRLLPEWSTVVGSTWLVYPSARLLPARVRALRDHLLAWFASPPAWTATAHPCAEAVDVPRDPLPG